MSNCRCGQPSPDSFSDSGHIQSLLWDTGTSEAARSWSSERPLTHPLDLGEEGLAMQATQCSIDGCAKPVRARGWCSMHWWRWSNHGDVNWVPPVRATECSIDECRAEPKGRGLCAKHLFRLRRTGTTDERVTVVITDCEYVARFWSRVDRRGATECWPWLGTILSTGYGQFWFPPKKRLAHRLAYELLVGPIPEGMTLDHVKAWGCTRTDCVNPAHLEPVTMSENVRRSHPRVGQV